MTFDITQVVYIILTVIAIPAIKLIWRWKSNMESRLEQTATKTELEQEIRDKLEPVKDNISDIKLKIDHLYDFLLTNSKK